MEKYNYLENVTADAKQAILENLNYWNFAKSGTNGATNQKNSIYHIAGAAITAVIINKQTKKTF